MAPRTGCCGLLGIDPPGETERLHSPEEIRMLVEQSTEGGSLEGQDARLLEGVFEFSEKTAQDVMTPRTQIAALNADLTVEEAADQVAVYGRSRYPVYVDSLDEIIGVVHAKDILAALRARPGQTIRIIMRPPLFVPGTREVEDVLADMKRLKTHLAIVLDEYGGTAGLVTMEDLLEEIVGPIYDEYDPQDRAGPTDGAPRLDGSMTISEFNSQFGATLDDTDYTTIGGYIFGQLGRLPRAGRPGERGSIHLRGGRDGGPAGEDHPPPRPQAGRGAGLEARLTPLDVPHLHRRDSSRRPRSHWRGGPASARAAAGHHGRAGSRPGTRS